jgi:hypothetical protein
MWCIRGNQREITKYWEFVELLVISKLKSRKIVPEGWKATATVAIATTNAKMILIVARICLFCYWGTTAVCYVGHPTTIDQIKIDVAEPQSPETADGMDGDNSRKRFFVFVFLFNSNFQ